MINSRQLEYFQAVARELHLTRAAESLRVAQPALSQQIRKLERQLGLPLFERDRHRVGLTAAGRALLTGADRILADLTAVEQEMLGWAGGVRGRIRVGAARGLLPRMAKSLSMFCQVYPCVDLDLREQATDEMMAGLIAGRLDVATLAMPVASGERRVVSHPLGGEPLVLVTGQDTPLAAVKRVRVGDLSGAELVFYPDDSGVGQVIAEALAAGGVEPRRRFEAREYGTARILASVGLAAAIMPRSIARMPGPAVHIVDLEPEPSWTPSLAWSVTRRPSPAQSAFTEFVLHRMEVAVEEPDESDAV